MKKIIYILAAFQIFIACNLFPQSVWVWQNPLPQGNDLFGLKMFDANTGMCINFYNILRTENGGQSWEQYYTGLDLNNKSIYMVNKNIGYISADSFAVFKTINGGINWTKMPEQSLFMNASLYFINSMTGFAYTSYNGKPYSVKMFKTTDGAISWNSVLSDTSFSVVSVQFINSTTGFASGTKYIYTTSGDYHSKFLKTTDGGNTWDTIYNTLRLQNTKLHLVNERTAYAYGDPSGSSGKVFKTTNAGVNWAQLNNFWTQSVYQIQFINELSGFLLAGNKIYKTSNSGLYWTGYPIITSGTSNVSQIFFSDLSTGYAVGTSGKILKTTNSGVNWESQSSGYLPDQSLWDVSFSDKNTGFTIGDYGQMLKTTNGGSSWELLEFNRDLDFSAIAKVNSNTWYIASWGNGRILKTTNTGLNWDTSYPNVYGPTRLEFINAQTGFGVCKYFNFIKTTNGGLNWIVTTPFGAQNWALDFVDENTGFVGNDGGRLYKTTDGGVTWGLSLPSPDNPSISDIQFINYSTGYIGAKYGSSGILKTTNGGINWMPILYGIYIYDINFINERIGFAVSHREVYKTSNGGNNWYKLRTCANTYILVAYFTDSLTGWVVGTNGTIIKTTNGGESIYTEPPEEIPTSFYLYQNYPNPFNPTTTIRYGLPKNLYVKIKIYDILGRLVTLLVNIDQPAGNYSVNFDGSNLASGVYFYTIETPEFTQSKKMVLLK